MFKLLLTGSRNWPDTDSRARIDYCLRRVAHKLCPEGGELSHGDATGVDTYGSVLWESFGSQYTTKSYPYPAGMGRRGGPFRNKQMVDAGADLCLGFPEGVSSGTRNCMEAARKANIPTFVFTSKLREMSFFEQYLADVDNYDPMWYSGLHV